MAETKICPNCGTINEKLDLEETQGVYICSKCKKLIDTKTNRLWIRIRMNLRKTTKKKLHGDLLSSFFSYSFILKANHVAP